MVTHGMDYDDTNLANQSVTPCLAAAAVFAAERHMWRPLPDQPTWTGELLS